ncbi:unnamed protein product [Prunus armeniaca]
MSNTESDHSDSPRAFEGESASVSSTAGLDSADFDEVVRGTEVSTKSGGTSSVEVVEVNNSQPSTSGHRAEATEADVSVADPGEELNALNEAELAKIRAEFHIPDSVVMQILGPLESLSNPDGEVVFFTDVFKH